MCTVPNYLFTQETDDCPHVEAPSEPAYSRYGHFHGHNINTRNQEEPKQTTMACNCNHWQTVANRLNNECHYNFCQTTTNIINNNFNTP
jgi:hypothetical protein